MRKLFYTLLCFFLFIGLANATTYYVRTDGNDSTCDGTQDEAAGDGTCAWASLDHAADNVSAGDTVEVGDGTYTDHDSDGYLLLKSGLNGSSGNEITFVAQNQYGAVLDGQEAFEDRGIRITTSSYLVFDGFEIKDVYWGSLTIVSSSYITIKNCKIHDIGRHEATSDPTNCNAGRAAMYTGSNTRNITIDRNLIYSIGRLQTNPEDCDYYHGDHGIYHCGAEQTTTNNIFYDIMSGYHISVRGHSAPEITTTTHTISNNTFINRVNTTNYGFINFYKQHDYRPYDVIIQNNISYSTSGDTLPAFVRSREGSGPSSSYRLGGTSNTLRNNVTSNTVYNDYDQFQVESGNKQLSDAALKAQMTDVDSNDFTLTADATDLIDQGHATGAPSLDFDGNSRPVNSLYDIGAYERAVGPILSGEYPTEQQPADGDPTTIEIGVTSSTASDCNYEDTSCSGETYATLADGAMAGGESSTGPHTQDVTQAASGSTVWAIICKDDATSEESNCVEITVDVASEAPTSPQPSPPFIKFLSGACAIESGGNVDIE